MPAARPLAVEFPNLTFEGALISPAMIEKIHAEQAPEMTADDYGIPPGLALRDEISRAFRIGQALHERFLRRETRGARATRNYVRALLEQVLGFADLAESANPFGLMAGNGRVPVAIVPASDGLDHPSKALSSERRLSASVALQDHLNAREEALWGLATNGMQIRLMRDNASLTRMAYFEADLARIFETDDIASFSLTWLLIHRSRFGRSGSPATDCALERWREEGEREGMAVRDRLAAQVEEALAALGTGFLEANPELRARLTDGQLDRTAFFNELLKLVYRIIFLMVAEDRNLLHPRETDEKARAAYAQGYSMERLRALALRRTAWDRHHDRYEGLKVVFAALARGEPRLGLPALGGLFAPSQMSDLREARLPNRALMRAILRLGWTRADDQLARINWARMQTEELGSVYESLLELQPQLSEGGRRLTFATAVAEKKGNQRKTTGSYYTPDSLVQALLDTALDPVLEEAEAAEDPEAALLDLSVIDPACGSGHFLIAAAHRIAGRLARIRAGGTPAAEDRRHALRDVVRTCIHGVDLNPMAVELTKVALWIETVDPGRPLGFLDAQIRCG
ncbi:MAG: restriction endonuclease, partial [Alphaproteobacteria bacterium]